jgi:hypothetical protein
MDQQDRLKKLAEALAAYIQNGDDGLVKVSKAAVDEVIMLLTIAASYTKPEPPPD